MLNPKKLIAARIIRDRQTVEQATANGRHIIAGQRLSVVGIRGPVRFVSYTRHASGAEWVDVIVEKTGRSRTVRPEAIRTVHLSIVAPR